MTGLTLPAAGVTPQRVADMLLAAGASPAMIDNPDEVGQFAGLADIIGGGLYLNCGLHSSQLTAMTAVADWRKSSADGVLVVDPVGYGATAWRSAAIEQMLAECRPDAIKGNASEIVGLSGAQASNIQMFSSPFSHLAPLTFGAHFWSTVAPG